MQFQIYLSSSFASNSSFIAIISIPKANRQIPIEFYARASNVLSRNLELQLAWPLAGVKMSIDSVSALTRPREIVFRWVERRTCGADTEQRVVGSRQPTNKRDPLHSTTTYA